MQMNNPDRKDPSDMTAETIVAIYDDVLSIEAACAELTEAGVPDDAISWTGAPIGAHSANARPRGFWSSLFGGEPDHDTTVYDCCVESGAHVLTVRAPAEHVAEVAAILERHQPIDIDERAAGHDLSGAASAGGDTIYGSGEAVVPLSEEQLSVGKRLVDRGTTRVRRFVVETAVAEDVTLHAERVVVERRPASGSVGANPAFTDKVVEMRETDEEAVIGKTARIAEEVVLHRVANDRVETIRDTLRHEDVEITRDGPTPATSPRRST